MTLLFKIKCYQQKSHQVLFHNSNILMPDFDTTAGNVEILQSSFYLQKIQYKIYNKTG